MSSGTHTECFLRQQVPCQLSGAESYSCMLARVSQAGRKGSPLPRSPERFENFGLTLRASHKCCGDNRLLDCSESFDTYMWQEPRQRIRPVRAPLSHLVTGRILRVATMGSVTCVKLIKKPGRAPSHPQCQTCRTPSQR